MMREKMHMIWLRMKGLFGRKRLEQDLDEEIAFHQAMREQAGEFAGQTRPRFGNATRIKEETRDQWIFAGLENFWRDLIYGFRVLRKSPTFTAVAILTLALGIGVNATIFSMLDGMALRPIPVENSGELYSVAQILTGKYGRNIHGSEDLVSLPEFQAYASQNRVFSELTALAPFNPATLGGEHKRQLTGTMAWCNYFSLLRVKAQLGRLFTDSDCAAPAASAVVVLNDRTWHSVFGGDPNIVGRTIQLNRVPMTVIGVAPPKFDGTLFGAAEFWVPVMMAESLYPREKFITQENLSWLCLLGRAKPGMTTEEMRANLSVIAAQFDARHPGRVTRIAVTHATVLDIPDIRPVFLAGGAVVLFAVSLVLIIVCANLANLLLARGAARRREISVRLALGASRGRLIRQLLTENMIVAIGGGILGTLFAIWSSSLIVRIISERFHSSEIGPFRADVGPDWRVLLFSLGISLLTGLAFGLLPALRTSRQNLADAMKSEGASVTGRRSIGGRWLVTVQVAVCMVLVLGTALVLRGLYHTQTFDPGFEMRGIDVVSEDLFEQNYTDAQAAAYQRQLVERLGDMPGVDAIAQCVVVPLSGSNWFTDFTVSGDSGHHQVGVNYVTAGYFRLLGIAIVRGRDFTPEEVATNAPVVIITEETARRFWPHQDPVGQSLHLSDAKKSTTIIGVVADATVNDPSKPHPVFLYGPPAANQKDELKTLVHGAGLSGGTMKAIASATQALDPDLIVQVAPLEENRAEWRAQAEVVSLTGGILGALALGIASLGVFGMVSYGVSRRLREFGIRMTIGAQANDVRNMVVLQALRPVALGIAIGIAASAAVSKVFSDVLFGVSAHDPLAFIATPVFLLLVALLACYLPARRITRLDPMKVLRYE